MITDYINVGIFTEMHTGDKSLFIEGRDFIADDNKGTSWVIDKNALPKSLPETLKRIFLEAKQVQNGCNLSKYEDPENVEVILFPGIVEHNTIILTWFNDLTNKIAVYTSPYIVKMMMETFPQGKWYAKDKKSPVVLKDQNKIVALVMPCEVHGDVDGYMKEQETILTSTPALAIV